MNLRSTVIGMFIIVALCGGSLYALQSYFSRESQMRDAERAFLTSHAEENAALPARKAKEPPPPSWDEPENEAPEVVVPEDEAPLTLDSWYAAAGTSEGPLDPTPEDNSYLINTAEPFSDGEPIG